MMPLAAFGEPDVVQLRREVEPVPPDVVEPVEFSEILKQGRRDGGHTLPVRQRIGHNRRFGHDRRGEGRLFGEFSRFGGGGGAGFRARFGAGGGQSRSGVIGFRGGGYEFRHGCGFRGGFLYRFGLGPLGLLAGGPRLGLRFSGGGGFRRSGGAFRRGRFGFGLRFLQLVVRMHGHGFSF